MEMLCMQTLLALPIRGNGMNRRVITLTRDTIRHRLREMRKSRKLSQKRLSELSGINVHHISAVESGRKGIGAEALVRYIYALGYRLADLEQPEAPDREWNELLATIRQLPEEQQHFILSQVVPHIKHFLQMISSTKPTPLQRRHP